MDSANVKTTEERISEFFEDVYGTPGRGASKIVRPHEGRLENSEQAMKIFSDTKVELKNDEVVVSVEIDSAHLTKSTDSIKTWTLKLSHKSPTGKSDEVKRSSPTPDTDVKGGVVSDSAAINDHRQHVKIFDSHCHIDTVLNNFKISAPSTWSNLFENFPQLFGTNFEGCITVNCNPKKWQVNLKKCLDNPDIFMTFGCHPRLSRDFRRQQELELEQLLKTQRVVAIGETGLDSKCNVPLPLQEDVFRRQLAIARRHNLPVCLHVRGTTNLNYRAHTIMAEVLTRDWPIHLHCFTDNMSMALDWIKNWTNLKFGVVPGKYKTDFVREVSLHRLLLETDAPYFVPMRKLKESLRKSYTGIPAYILDVATEISEIKNIPVDVILAKSRENVQQIYKIPVKVINASD